MRSILWTSALLTLTTLLASCGGGGSPSTPPSSPSTSAVCDSNTLWGAQPESYGRGIPDNNGTGITVSWDNQNCTLRTISSAELEICLRHPRTTDLTWAISPPASGAELTLTVPSDWNTSGSSCDSGQGKFQRMDLLPTVSSTVTTRGIWTLNVKDQILGDEGTLIQWRVVLRGNT